MLGAGLPQPPNVRYLFIDAGCLNATVKRWGKLLGRELSFNIDRITVGYAKVFYYDAFPDAEPNEDPALYDQRVAPVRDAHARLREIPGVHVFEGDLRRSKRNREGRRQKKIDIAITVDMLTHTFSRNMHTAALLASDLDFEPLLNALVQSGMNVELIYPTRDTNPELPAAADVRTRLLLRTYWHALGGTPVAPKCWLGPARFADPGLISWQTDRHSIVYFKAAGEEIAGVTERAGLGDTMMFLQHPSLSVTKALLIDEFGAAAAGQL